MYPFLSIDTPTSYFSFVPVTFKDLYEILTFLIKNLNKISLFPVHWTYFCTRQTTNVRD